MTSRPGPNPIPMGSEATFRLVLPEQGQVNTSSDMEEPVTTRKVRGDRLTRAPDSLGTALQWSGLY